MIEATGGNTMSLPPEPATSGLPALLRGIVRDLQRASGADMVSLFLYDEDGSRYYAPFAVGQPEDSLSDSLADVRGQLARYLADRAQGKVPDELRVPHYGSTVWLTVTRRPLIARDAPTEIDSTFIRRHRVRSTIGLPLIAGSHLVGLLYLNYCDPPNAGSGAAGPGTTPGATRTAPTTRRQPGTGDGDAVAARVPDDEALAALQRRAADAAMAIQAALVRSERRALDGLRRLSIQLTAPAEEGRADAGAIRRLVSIAIADLLLASELDGAAVYELSVHRDRLELVTAHAPAAFPARIDLPPDRESWEQAEAALGEAVNSAMGDSGLHPAGSFSLGPNDDPDGYLVVLSRDRLASVRKPPAIDVLLEAGADLVAGALASRRLIRTLESSNDLLGALGQMTNSMLRPGSTRQDVLQAVVGSLTDATVPEFDFHFATIYLLDQRADGTTVVRLAAGATTTDEIDAAQVEADGGEAVARVPRWVLEKDRVLAPQDVLVFVARGWQVAVIGPVPPAEGLWPRDLIAGRVPVDVRKIRVPVVRRDGIKVTAVPGALIGEPGRPEASPAPPARDGARDGVREAVSDGEVPFTLAGEIFERSGHGELTRIFVPFGLATDGAATGVLEVGYHRSAERRPDWGQIEALRSAAAQVAVAVETARLYEETRHHAEQLELSADISEAIASSIDLEQTLRLVARNLVRLVDASFCQIALYEEDGEGWYGAAASDQEELWRRQRAERPEQSLLFDLLDRGEPVLVEDVAASDLVKTSYVEAFGVRALLALPLVADGQPIGAAVLGQRDQPRTFTADEVRRAQGLAHQAAVAIKNARLHALVEEERHIQKDFVLIGLGQWGQKAYQHLQTLKQFFNFRLHVVEHDSPTTRERLGSRVEQIQANGDTFYWDSPASPAHDALARQLEPSCYSITYIATPAATHLDTLARYYDLSDVVLIEKPLGSPPEAYREFLDTAPGGVELVAADHYYFKLEVRLLQQLLTVERTLRDFLDSVEEIRIEILEAQPLTGAAADIGVIADLIPHAFAIISLFTPIERIRLDETAPLVIGRHDDFKGQRESYARLNGTFPYQGRSVRLIIEVGKGVENAKWIRLSGESRMSGRRPFYKFDFGNGEAVDGTQSTVRAAVRGIREPGVPDNAHLTMLRHVIEKQRPAVGILSIREAIRANQRVRELEALAGELLARQEWTPYALGSRPHLGARPPTGNGAGKRDEAVLESTKGR
jgi:GAF domain-containing protein